MLTEATGVGGVKPPTTKKSACVTHRSARQCQNIQWQKSRWPSIIESLRLVIESPQGPQLNVEELKLSCLSANISN